MRIYLSHIHIYLSCVCLHVETCNEYMSCIHIHLFFNTRLTLSMNKYDTIYAVLLRHRIYVIPQDLPCLFRLSFAIKQRRLSHGIQPGVSLKFSTSKSYAPPLTSPNTVNFLWHIWHCHWMVIVPVIDKFKVINNFSAKIWTHGINSNENIL